MPQPLPYGLAPNADVLESLMSHAIAQGIIPMQVPIADLFAAPVRQAVG